MKSSSRSDSEASATTNRPPTKKSASLLLLATALDTTWRFFAPLLGGLFIGIGLDTVFHTAPLFVIVMLMLGIVGAGLLVRQQLKNVRSPR
jgi:F0F1-type ATP synthase assembly protein I